MPPRGSPPADGRWVMCGYGRFGRHLTEDLRAEGLEVTIVEPKPIPDTEGVVVGDGFEPAVMERAGVATAAGFVAGTDNDTSNLSLIAAARRVNPDLWVAARQNLPTSESLFAVMEVDALLVPTEVVAHEVFAQLSTPLLWRFLQEAPAWATTGRPARAGKDGRAAAGTICPPCGRSAAPRGAPRSRLAHPSRALLFYLLRNRTTRDQQLPCADYGDAHDDASWPGRRLRSGPRDECCVRGGRRAACVCMTLTSTHREYVVAPGGMYVELACAVDGHQGKLTEPQHPLSTRNGRRPVSAPNTSIAGITV